MTDKVRLESRDERDVHSQEGEDGIIEKIVSTLGIEGGTAVEFGAWDGTHLSNTALLRERGWTTVLIEGDPAKVRELEKLAGPKTIVMNAMVMPEGESSLDRLLAKCHVERVDLLSIDIDGDDIHILSALRLRPRIICIEYNPSIGPPAAYINPRGECHGSSISSICAVGRTLGYELVYATRCNAFLVAREDAELFEVVDAFHAYHAKSRPQIFALYDGGFGISNARDAAFRNEWSTVPVFVPRPPRFLRRWPTTNASAVLTYLYCALVSPFFYVAALVRTCVRLLRQRPAASDEKVG